MRRARAALGAVMLLAIVTLPLPASAKGFPSATITGPGLPDGGLTIRGNPHGELLGPVVFLLMQSGFFSEKLPGPRTVGLDPADLGAPYRMVVASDWDPPWHVTLVLYPYAKGGPWVYTPPNERVNPATEASASGWWKVGHRLIGSYSPRIANHFRAILVHHGLPVEAPPVTAIAHPPSQPVARAAPSRSSPGRAAPYRSPPGRTAWVWAWIPIGAAIGGAMLLVASARRRRVAG